MVLHNSLHQHAYFPSSTPSILFIVICAFAASNKQNSSSSTAALLGSLPLQLANHPQYKPHIKFLQLKDQTWWYQNNSHPGGTYVYTSHSSSPSLCVAFSVCTHICLTNRVEIFRETKHTIVHHRLHASKLQNEFTVLCLFTLTTLGNQSETRILNVCFGGIQQARPKKNDR